MYDSDSSRTPEPGRSDPWSSGTKHFVQEVRKTCIQKANYHLSAARVTYRRELVLRVPSVVVPAVCGPLVLLMQEQQYDAGGVYVSSCGFIVTSVLTALLSYFRYGEQSRAHFVSSSQYEELAYEIDVEMAKHVEFRITADVFMTKIKLQLDRISALAPSELLLIKTTTQIHSPQKSADPSLHAV